MTKKSYVSSQPARPVRRNSRDIFSKPLSDQQREVITLLAARQQAGDESHINFNDIPELTDEQLSRMVRARDQKPSKVALSVRLDKPVLDWLKSKGGGHLTRINDILANVMEAEKRMLDAERK
jgi:uncharacterized protein (DUF4415 family)